MNSYIDIHTHILPGIDDGPPDLESALDLARGLVKQGFSTVIATPHSCEGVPPAEEILDCWRLFTAELSREEIALQVLPGAELLIEPQLLRRVREGLSLTLNRGRYLLIELPLFQELPLYTEELLFELQAHGYQPILGHPERVKAFQKDLSGLAKLVSRGIFLQLTLSSLTGLMGREVKQTAWAMLSQRLVHFVATDAHSNGRRLSQKNRALQLLEKKHGPGTAAVMLSENPRRMLLNEELKLAEPASKSRFCLFNALFN